MINVALIKRFRDAVNENDFILFKYRDNNNKNQWNCICSAMDWITVAVEHLQKFPWKRSREIESMEMFSYIASIDLIIEAVTQLNRVIFQTSKQLFECDSECFKGNVFHKSDLDYFKTIRACFGAHPVNLDEPGQENEKGKRRFASWSGEFCGGGDFSVILYSNQTSGSNIYLSIKFKEIFEFAKKYYNYLEKLIEEIERQYLEFREKMKTCEILCTGTSLERLYVLKDESKKRLNNSYYRSTIDELIMLFETSITNNKNNELIEEYLKAAEIAIEEIYTNFQNMTLVDLESEDILHPMPTGLPDGWGYWIEKLSQAVFGSGYPIEVWGDRIKEIFGSYFEFDFQDEKELYLLVHATLYKISKQ